MGVSRHLEGTYDPSEREVSTYLNNLLERIRKGEPIALETRLWLGLTEQRLAELRLPEEVDINNPDC
jgi:hypothetical protein